MPSFYAIERKPLHNILNRPTTVEQRHDVELRGDYHDGSNHMNIGVVTLASGMKRVLFFNDIGTQDPEDTYIYSVVRHAEDVEKV
mgnify:CR=1 FL=1